MRGLVATLVLACVCGAGALLYRGGPVAPPTATAGARAATSPEGWLMARRMRGSTLSLATLRKASEDFERLATQSLSRRGGSPEWTFLGPENIGGRILDIAVDPTSANTIFVAAASGGVWRSADAATTFQVAWPAGNAQAVGALAITSTGVLFAGTGESGPGGGSLTYGNAGVFKSTDSGANWTSLGLTNSERISRVVIDPGDETRIFVAATGPLYAPGGERGVYRSVDGGANWTLVLAGENATTGGSDVFVDPTNPNRIWAVMWDHLRQPSLRRYGGVGSGVFRSLDGGDTWARLGGGLPVQDADTGRIALGVAPSNPDRLYATYLDARGFFTGFYTSTDGGNNWSSVPNQGGLGSVQASFGWWFARLWVDPANESRVFGAGTSLARSTTAGNGWALDTTIHADQHAMAWDPDVPNRVYLGNDGGVYRSSNNGEGPWAFGTVQPYTQFYTLDVGEQDPNRLVGGTQDNFCLRSWTAANPNLWNIYDGCGDGLATLINYQDQNLIYGCSQYGNCVRSLNGGESTFGIGGTFSSRRNWYTPLVFDPNDPSIMYYAGDTVNRSTDGGDSWTFISPDLTGGDPFPSIDPYPFGTVTTVAPAKSDPNVIYAGTDDARLWYTRNLGGNWTRVNDADLPDRWVTQVLVNPGDADIAYATFSGYRDADDTPYVFKTVDGGADWFDVTSNLPAAPVNAIEFSPLGGLIVASDLGVFFSENDGASWDVLGQGLPRAPAMDLRVHIPTNTVTVATFGRGIWRTTIPESDADTDGVADAIDNCTLIANADQRDTNGDGFGNVCDADLNNDGTIDFIDLGVLKQRFFSMDADADFNGDGTVDFLDLGVMKLTFFGSPGPSGLAN